MTPIDQLKDQLSPLVGSESVVRRLVELADARLDAMWDELTSEEVSELDSWLGNFAQAVRREEQIKWGLVRDVFATIRETRGSG
jgi:hypothetical protein